ncbi:hypothetical protein EAY46_26895, partial [Vibrio anguillarum]|nr:hypothetical protein [Vibrio anguillarum]
MMLITPKLPSLLAEPIAPTYESRPTAKPTSAQASGIVKRLRFANLSLTAIRKDNKPTIPVIRDHVSGIYKPSLVKVDIM